MKNLALQLTEESNQKEENTVQKKRTNKRRKVEKTPFKLPTNNEHTPIKTKELKNCCVCTTKAKFNKRKVKTTCQLKCIQCDKYVHLKCWKDHKIK